MPQPCTENWDKMTPNEKGRHCANCNKTIIDFSKYTDRELLDFISKAQGSICGRISSYQLNRSIIAYDQNNSSFLQRFILGATMATSLAACNTPNTQADNKYISGRVIDSREKPIGSIHVSIKGTSLSATTDSTGYYKIPVKDSMVGKRIQVELTNARNESVEQAYTVNKLPFYTGYLVGQGNEEIALTGVICANPHDSNYVHSTVEDTPKFNGDVNDYILKHIKYPKGMQDNGIEGTVYVNFIIEKLGKISNVRVLKGVAGGAELDSAAVKVIKNMPKWIPGKLNGRNVRTAFNIPIKFTLDE